jgi:hypothetical protein
MSSPTPAEVIIHGGRIATLDRAQPFASALAIAHGRVLAIGGPVRGVRAASAPRRARLVADRGIRRCLRPDKGGRPGQRRRRLGWQRRAPERRGLPRDLEPSLGGRLPLLTD